MNINKIQIKEGFCYPEYPLIDLNTLIVSLRFSENDAREDLCKYSEIRSINIANHATNWIYSLEDKEDQVKGKPIIHNELIIVCTNDYLFALDKKNGTIVWKIKVRLYDPSISIIDGILYLNEKNETTLFDIKVGKKIKSKKYRIQWLCGSVVEYNGRLFISTSNSKIIEISKDTLEIINEFKFVGKWAIGVAPLFFDNRMYSNSYTSNVICFDLEINNPIWKVKKNAGSEPKHILLPNEMYCAIEAFNPTKITTYSFEKGKKLWSKEYHIHSLENFDKQNLIGLLKNEDEQYNVCLINKKDGKIEKSLLSTGYHFDERFQYRLWEGAEIAVTEKLFAITFSPNEIFIIER